MAMMGRGRIGAAVLALVACAGLLGACGGGSEEEGGGESGKAVTLKVGVIPIADVAPLYVGIRKGFFKEENLELKPTLAEGGAQIVAGTVSGGFDIGFSNVTSLLIAGSKNVPVQILASGVNGGAKPNAKEAFDALIVKDRAIKSAKDLEGKTISVNTLQNVGPLAINRAMEKAGADYKKVKYVEVPFPEAVQALTSGRVDAAWVVEPFVSQGKGEGARQLLFPFEEVAPDFQVATYFAAKPYIEKNADVVERFTRAIKKSLDYSQSHPEAVRKEVLEYTEIPAPAAKAMVLPQWSSEINRPTIETTSKLAKQYGFLKEEPNLDELIKQE
jgi:NitT/TauT family transport system substrate-binding protein